MNQHTSRILTSMQASAEMGERDYPAAINANLALCSRETDVGIVQKDLADGFEPFPCQSR